MPGSLGLELGQVLQWMITLNKLAVSRREMSDARVFDGGG
jgi:hypothetical protein